MILLLVLSLLFSIVVHAIDAPGGQEMDEGITLEEVLCDSYSCLIQCGCLDGPIRTYVTTELEEERLCNSEDSIERNWGSLQKTMRRIVELGVGYGCAGVVRYVLPSSPQAACMCGSSMAGCGWVLYENYHRIMREEVAKED